MYLSRFFRLKPHALYLFTFSAILLFTSWNNLTEHFLYRTKAGNSAYHLAVTTHQLNINGKVLNYQATAGYLPLDEKGERSANIFYTAYTAAPANNATKRPITFVFNGGPGSASIWLHMGSFGPVRVAFKNDKGDTDAQSNYQNNPYTWLGFTDLVFIDPVSTGYSRAGENVDGQQFSSYENDIASIGRFIKNYLVQNHREGSPKYLTGESYGALRAIGLTDYLKNQYQIDIDGLTLISPALNYQLIKFDSGNETPYSYYLPSYALAAQYHHHLSPELQRLSPNQLLNRASAFAHTTYTYFLSQGDNAPTELTARVADSVSYFTGLSKDVIVRSNGRITDKLFVQNLLGGTVTGTFDSRFTGADKNTDPSEANLRGTFIASFAGYVKKDLAYQNDLAYQATTATGNWNYGAAANNSYLNISSVLKKVMVENPSLKVQVAAGYYDLATPVESTEYVIHHLGLSSSLRSNIKLNYYQSGHMIYISSTADAKFKNDSEKFYNNALTE